MCGREGGWRVGEWERGIEKERERDTSNFFVKHLKLFLIQKSKKICFIV